MNNFWSKKPYRTRLDSQFIQRTAGQRCFFPSNSSRSNKHETSMNTFEFYRGMKKKTLHPVPRVGAASCNGRRRNVYTDKGFKTPLAQLRQKTLLWVEMFTFGNIPDDCFKMLYRSRDLSD